MLNLFRDLLIPHLPSYFVKKLFSFKGEYAFLVHPLESNDLLKKFPFLSKLTTNKLNIICRYLWPIIGGQMTGFKNRKGEEVGGWIVACPLTAKQLINYPNIARRRVIKTVKLAEKLGSKIIGLGAFSSISTHGGLDVVDKTKIAITSGNSYAAALIILNLKKIAKEINANLKSLTVSIVGAAGSVGSACSQIVPQIAAQVLLIDKDESALDHLYNKIKAKGIMNIEYCGDHLGALKVSDVIITVSSSAEGILEEKHLKPGTIIIDAAQPKNVSQAVLVNKDYLVINSGIAKMPGIKSTLDVGLYDEEVYACLGEVLTLTWKDRFDNFSLGKVNPNIVEELIADTEKVGLSVAPFRNSLGIIYKEQFDIIRDNRKSKQLSYS